MKLKAIVFIVLLMSLAFPATAFADGIIIPEPRPCLDCPPPPCLGPQPCPLPSPMVQLAIRYHHVDVTIQDQVAVTHVDQVFFNPNNWAVEGTYLFPLPVDAAVSSFTLWVDGEPVEGQILDAEQARQTYRQIVSSLRDPALLEYAGRGAVQAHIFPIPPQGERRIELEYTQALAAENGLVRYVYPLGTEKYSTWPLESVAINVDIQSSQPIRAIYSPSHTVAISRENENHARAGYEAQNVLPDNDFALYYSIGKNEAFHLMSYRSPLDDDPHGFFLLLLAPSPEQSPQAIPKDVLLVIDRSGSMEGEKFRRAQDALRYVLTHLNPEDRFNLIAFSTGLETYSNRMNSAEQAGEALAWVERQSAQGSTDINRALLEAATMVDRERPTYLIFLTDGLPTEGEVVSQKILDNFRAAAPENLRLFPFGVGYDVDTFLLDSLAQENHGASTYVLPGENLEEALSTFYARISTPVLTDLALDFGSIPVYDLYPDPLPDLFEGSQIILVGRYREGGNTDVKLTGQVNGETQTFTFPEQQFIRNSTGMDLATAGGAPASGPQSMIPRLWATRKIGHLLNQIRLNGPNQEIVDQIVRLSIRYGIVTPYTSYLVTEPATLGAAEQNRIAHDQFNQMQSLPTAAASGQAAVQKAADQASLAGAEAPAEQSAEAAGRVRQVGARTYVLSGEQWIDTAFDPQQMKTVKVAFLSEDYFTLAERYPELGAAFALGQSVIAFADGVAYQVVPQDSQVSPLKISTAQAVPTQPLPAETVQPTLEPTARTGSAVTPVQPATPEPDKRNPLLCGGGLLPILLLPIGMITLQVWKKRLAG
jgi:Ca-activated chloride channel homolog